MTKIRFKPLLLAIPVCLVMAAAIIVDSPQSGSKSAKAGSDNKNVEIIADVDLVIGNAGSLDNDIGSPIRAGASANAEEIGCLQYNCCVMKGDSRDDDEWISVSLNDGREGFVEKQTAAIDSIKIKASDKRHADILNESLAHIGTRFVVGGKSLEKGIDCSNFVQAVYKSAGVMIPNTPNKIKASGEVIKKSEAKPGDVVYYDVNNGGGHVAIYLGENYQISSMGHSGKTYPEGGIRICRLKYRDRENPIFVRIFE